ncbi:MAG: glycoside hydrolase family 31 protein [Chloroflexi bacterium]|nr:glycoside hydrolase family 31 protein [Chloroflexota bacterium]
MTWWQSQLRRLLDMGVRGFKTDFGEQIPADAVFSDGRTGAELHNSYPVLYNRATWEVVREYDGILLGRSGWAGSQAYPAVWAGDQTSDFSPWNGLPTAIVAGQSAGWSGFPYWGSDVGGYFGAPDDEVFVRWTQFAALTPIMESHGLGVREPWLFAPSTLETYRAFAALHARLAPYTQSAASEAFRTGLPIMRAMALSFPELPDIHQDWVQYQYLYGPDLLVAPVYSWGRRRQVLFPPGEWIDFFSGARYAGPSTVEVPARLESLPLFVRAGTLLPLLRDTRTSSASNASNASDASSGQALHLELYPGGSTERLLADGSRLVLDSRPGEAAMRVRVAGPEREYTLSARHAPALRLIHSSAATVAEGSTLRWRGDAELELVQGV